MTTPARSSAQRPLTGPRRAPAGRAAWLAALTAGWIGPWAPAAAQVSPAAQPTAPPTASTSAPPPPPAAAAGDAEEAEATIYLKDGQEFSGQLIAQDQQKVVLRIAGIATTFAADHVERVRVLPSVMERYRALRDAIDDRDVEQMLRLVDWLVERRRFDLALSELRGLVERQPQSNTAKRKLATVEKMAALRERRPAGQAGPDRAGAAAPAAGIPAVPLLSDAQIALMKVFEVDLTARPRVVIPPEATRRLFEDHGTDPAVPQTPEGREALLRRPGYEILDVLFAARARDLYPLVKVIDQPDGLRRFRDDALRSWIANSCATSQCHGGTDAGRLILVNRALGTDPAVYTNFWILSRFRLAGGAPLVDWDAPAKSPLVQMGLPRNRSTTPHPPVPRGPDGRDLWKPAFLSEDDQRFQATVAWIQAMYRPRPDYTLDYTPARPFAPAGPSDLPRPAGQAVPAAPISGPPVVERPASEGGPPAGRPPAPVPR